MKIKLFSALCLLLIIYGCDGNKPNKQDNLGSPEAYSKPGEGKTIKKKKKLIPQTNDISEIEGRHKLSLQWISWDDFGYIDFEKIDANIYKVKGIQESNESNEECRDCFLKIEGKITQISEKVLSFTGKIESSVHYIQNGTPCVKEGTFEFKSTGNRKYWRCQNMNGCDGVTDYVDIYFEKIY
jgi:hypothetical protein